MTKKITLFLLFLCAINYAKTQVVSYFSWDNAPATAADIGPDASFISTSAIVDVGGSGGTNGLNAGLPKRDLTMTILGSPTFDLDGIDIQFDYQREESFGVFFQRGSSLIINGCNSLSVSFRVEDGAGGFNTVSSGVVYNIPNDDVFRTYRFYYLPTTGEAELSVDGSSVWTNDGADNRNLYWVGAGDVVIGGGMDGSGTNDTFLDEFIIGNVTSSPLPIELINFTATPKEDKVKCEWKTKSEQNNAYFIVERSLNTEVWEELGEVKGAGNSVVTLNYDFTDNNPIHGISYYRLKQIDFNADFSYSDIETVNFKKELGMEVYPNPTNRFINVRFNNSTLGSDPFVFVLNKVGQKVNIPFENTQSSLSFDFSSYANGVYFISVNGNVEKVILER